MKDRITIVAALFAIAGFSLGPSFPALEGRLLPVVEPATITSVEPAPGLPGWSIVRGTANKLRACGFSEIRWFLGDGEGGSSRAQVRFMDAAEVRRPDPFSFGPWLVHLTPEQLKNNSYAIVLHDCHPWWEVSTIFWNAFDRK